MPILADRVLRMVMVGLRGEIHDAPIPVNHHEGLLIDEPFSEPRAAMHLRNGSIDNDGSV